MRALLFVLQLPKEGSFMAFRLRMRFVTAKNDIGI